MPRPKRPDPKTYVGKDDYAWDMVQYAFGLEQRYEILMDIITFNVSNRKSYRQQIEDMVEERAKNLGI